MSKLGLDSLIMLAGSGLQGWFSAGPGVIWVRENIGLVCES